MIRVYKLSVSMLVLGSMACTGDLRRLSENTPGSEDSPDLADGTNPGDLNDPNGSGSGSGSGSPGSANDPGRGDSEGSDGEALVPQAVAARIYTAKLKSLIVGEPLSAEELSQVEADPAELRTLVSAWIDRPRAKAKLQNFFTTAFQQEGFEDDALARHFSLEEFFLGTLPGSKTKVSDVLPRSFRDSFGRTALYALDNDWSFDRLVSTNQFMMTTAMMVSIALNDELIVDDEGEMSHRTLDGTEIVYQRHENYPLDRVLDPEDDVFLHFYSDNETVVPDECLVGEVRGSDPRLGVLIYSAMMGTFVQLQGRNRICRKRQRTQVDTLLDAADFEDWRLVTIRRPRTGEEADRFFELGNLRGSTELVLHTPRVGFFTTPAFVSVWETNRDNQARGTMNQTLITAYGQSIDGEQVILPEFNDALNGEHADPTTSCYACHKTLDPMRQFFRRDYTYSFHQQQSDEVRQKRADFAWDGVQSGGSSIEEFAALLVGHPNLARGWTQKLCWYANSAPCPEGEEFERVVRNFSEGGMNFRDLLVELLSSPLVTGATPVPNGNGDLPSVARVRHFCAALSARVDEPDVCGLYSDIDSIDDSGARRLRLLNSATSGVIPDDTFARGDQNPIAISDVGLFSRNAYEKICISVAKERVDNGDPLFDFGDADPTLENLVTRVAAIPENDPRYPKILESLREHYETAQRQTNPGAAMRSAFVVACLAPSSIGIGF